MGLLTESCILPVTQHLIGSLQSMWTGSEESVSAQTTLVVILTINGSVHLRLQIVPPFSNFPLMLQELPFQLY